MTKQLEIDYAFGYVYDKSKLVVMYPVGSNIIDENEYEMEVEVAFLEDGIEVAFEESDIKEANDTIKPLEMFLMKPSKIIPFVTSIKDYESKEENKKLLKEFDEEYKVKESYINKGYEIRDVYHVFENVVKYIPQENLDTLNILKIEKEKFDMDKFIETTKNNLDEAINSELIPVNMEKSNLTNRLFLKTSKDTSAKYVVFGTDISTYSEGILCANKEIIKDMDLDMGDLEVSNTKDVGYLIEEVDGYLTFKISNYNSQTPNGNQLAQIVDYSGVFKKMMIDFIGQFIK
ncbi:MULTISPECIES: hypothetical protein [Romboutsia]|uniref:Uncharacterized protein n=1 Tax=Romboutsia hominis TaxID=1507512 RepID=A0A2P2BNJ4_9FIRM|nr:MULTISPECIES: hypothetical protein [Romboutsia]MCH1959417.1 hypothetical protein [Romboutsia hominis]MCH1970316.1 hypothetical protein [Romboutsia hominis]CEI71927.1 Hypothetical protein FRIFI_0379 [Romboutsia hominis]